MNIGWYYSDNNSPSDELVDAFADSKFGIDRWSSFTREIIQNSLDAQDDQNKPVEVCFDLNKQLKIDDIPGGRTIKDVLKKCTSIASNKQTKSAYLKGEEILSKDYVYCLKISDKNTSGVKTGRDEAWGAFVFDEGKSIKQRPGSAGSHGVGKKVPFIISTCNTVFYSTKNKYEIGGVEKSDCLMQGKTMLINWTDDAGKRKDSKGWYGVIDDSVSDTKNIVRPIDIGAANNSANINPYFLRSSEYGTDVIIVGVNAYDDELKIKEYIINAILDNFFVAILEKKLIVTVFDEEISSDSFDTIVSRYYRDTSNNKNNLNDCLSIYDKEKAYIEDIIDSTNQKIGSVKIFFGLGNERNAKYYTIVRSHGMKITEKRVNRASQPYTAVVLIEGETLNSLLSSLENAAHDEFVTKDENMDINKDAIYAINEVERIVANYIIEQTKIDAENGQEIDDLGSIISIPGSISTVNRKNSKPQIKRNSVARKGKGDKNGDYNQGVTSSGSGSKKHKTKKGKNKPAKKGGGFDSILFEDYDLEPIFIKTDSEYSLKLQVANDIKKADLVISSINSEGKRDDSIVDYIDSVTVDGTARNCNKGKLSNLSFYKGKTYVISVKMKRSIFYQLTAEIYVKEDNANA